MKAAKKTISFLAILLVSIALCTYTYASQDFLNDEESRILNSLGLYDGVSPTSFVPDLAAPVDRETAIALLVKMFGSKQKALALTDSEAASALSGYSDSGRISTWARKYLAYAVRTGMVQGDTAATLSPEKPVDGKSYATMMLRNLGYKVNPEDWKLALDALASKGGLTAAQALRYDKASLIKDEIVGISYGSLSARSPSGSTLIEILIAKGVVDKTDALKAGLTNGIVPRPLPDPAEDDPAYQAVKNALLQQMDKLDISRYSIRKSSSDVFKLVRRVVLETPQILYYNGCSFWSDGKLEFQYARDQKTALAHMDELDKKADAIISEVVDIDMKDYEKELAVHDYIIRHCVYDSENLQKGTLPPESFSAYGVLVKGRGVCEGYSEAMKLIMDKLRIECRVITGKAGGMDHAWNIIQLDGRYYQLDITWNDPVTQDGSNVLRYDYFNITDAEMAAEHEWNASGYPSCSGRRYNYFVYNGLTVDSQQAFISAVKAVLEKGGNETALKILPSNDGSGSVLDTYDIEAIIERAFREVPGLSFKGYSYNVNQAIGVVSIRFK